MFRIVGPGAAGSILRTSSIASTPLSTTGLTGIVSSGEAWCYR